MFELSRVITVRLFRRSPLRQRRFAQASDPLPSWNDGAVEEIHHRFVARATTQGGADFVPPAERIAVFDNDGTLWCEQPMYFQAAFALDRVKAMAPQHPEWKDPAAVQGVPLRRQEGAAPRGEKGLLTLVAAAHSGMTTDVFAGSSPTGSRPQNIRDFNRP